MSFAPGPSRQPTLRRLEGTTPGRLDPAQSQRVLNLPGSKLSFASFDPLCASGFNSGTRRRAPDADPARPRRIVIETPLRGPSRWRFVPRAHRAQGVEDEGMWPRKVNICGEFFLCSEDQWDIYKLDPFYECFIPAAPDHPTVRRKEPLFDHMSIGDSYRGSTLPTNSKKRRAFSPVAEGVPASSRKKFRTVVDERGMEIEEEVTSSDEEDEVEDIMDDGEVLEGPATPRKRRDRSTQRRKPREERAREIRPKPTSKAAPPEVPPPRPKTPDIVDLTMDDSSQEPSRDRSPEPAQPDITTSGSTKRKVFASGDATDERSSAQESNKPSKRARTLSPNSIRTELGRKIANRRTAKVERARVLKEQRDEQFWQDILREAQAEARLPTPPSSQSADGQQEEDMGARSPQSSDDSDDAARKAAIEESRRKLAELEKDRPLWDEAARQRAAQERAEEEAIRARKAAEERRAAETAAREAQERRHRQAAAAEAERREQAERERLRREREQRRERERARWSYGPWTPARAIERYKALADAFDAAKFGPAHPAEFELVPWPVLQAPATLRIEDIDWAGVEAFFGAAKRCMRPQDYKAFVEKSHKRFHPDRWRARGVLKSIEDEDFRGSLEVAANTVAQALTPLWRDTRG